MGVVKGDEVGRALKPRGWAERNDGRAKVLKERRAPRRTGSYGDRRDENAPKRPSATSCTHAVYLDECALSDPSLTVFHWIVNPASSATRSYKSTQIPFASAPEGRFP